MPYKKTWDKIKKIYPLIAADNIKMKILKCKIYLECTKYSEEEIKKIFAYLNQKPEIANQLEFKKINKNDFISTPILFESLVGNKPLGIKTNELANSIELTLDGKYLTKDMIRFNAKKWLNIAILQSGNRGTSSWFPSTAILRNPVSNSSFVTNSKSLSESPMIDEPTRPVGKSSSFSAFKAASAIETAPPETRERSGSVQLAICRSPNKEKKKLEAEVKPKTEVKISTEQPKNNDEYRK